MKDLKDQKIEKLKEIINWLEMRLNDLDSFDKYNQLKSDLTNLDAQPHEKNTTISDKDIEREFPVTHGTTELTFTFAQVNEQKREGAKWYKEELASRQKQLKD